MKGLCFFEVMGKPCQPGDSMMPTFEFSLCTQSTEYDAKSSVLWVGQQGDYRESTLYGTPYSLYISGCSERGESRISGEQARVVFKLPVPCGSPPCASHPSYIPPINKNMSASAMHPIPSRRGPGMEVRERARSQKKSVRIEEARTTCPGYPNGKPGSGRSSPPPCFSERVRRGCIRCDGRTQGGYAS